MLQRIISQTKRVREDRPIYYPEYEVEYVEKIVDVPVYVDKPVEKDVNMHDMTARSTEVIHGEYRHNSVPVVVAQTVKPIITEASESVDVDVCKCWKGRRKMCIRVGSCVEGGSFTTVAQRLCIPMVGRVRLSLIHRIYVYYYT